LFTRSFEQAEEATEKIGNLVDSTGDVLISAGETIKSVKKSLE
jgi:uncharacterized protein YoaH (UPF0181 family)